MNPEGNLQSVVLIFFHFVLCFRCFSKMSDNPETAEDSEETNVTDDLCTMEIIEIVPIDRTSDDCHTPECNNPVVEVKSEDLQDVKQETADESDTEDAHYSVKHEPVDDDNTDIQLDDVNTQSSVGMFHFHDVLHCFGIYFCCLKIGTSDVGYYLQCKNCVIHT